ncbi:MAG: hypothetical protein ACK443_05815 [Methylococcaceae bacterium]|jgi:hypothetical protein
MHVLNTNINDADVLVQYTLSGGRPGRYFGPPEHCYPDEPLECEISAVLFETETPAGETIFVDVAPLLGETIRLDLEIQCLEYAENPLKTLEEEEPYDDF